ncbi:hypothetical protein [Terrabacter lapilli]|uniref:hypothetical protein n=1 Tax=Terrabacter lapilli TaxID=436231 RepID=UPI0031DB2E78
MAIGVLTLTGSTGWLTAAGWVGEAELASLVHQAGIRRQLQVEREAGPSRVAPVGPLPEGAEHLAVAPHLSGHHRDARIHRGAVLRRPAGAGVEPRHGVCAGRRAQHHEGVHVRARR